jgi:hypothetical protein
LNDARIREVSELAESCERARGAPQDVEWAYAHGALYLLQSRPITAQAPASNPPSGRWIAFKPILENFTDALTPLTVDIAPRTCRRSGNSSTAYYLDFDGMKKLVPFVVTDAEFAELALLKSERSDYRIRWARLLPVAIAVFAAYVSNNLLWVRSRHLPFGSLSQFRDRCQAILDNPNLDPVASLRLLLWGPHPFAPASQFPFQVNIASVRYFFLLAALRWFLRRFGPKFDATLIERFAPAATIWCRPV